MKTYINFRNRSRLDQFAARLNAATILTKEQKKQLKGGGIVTIPLGNDFRS